MPSLILLFLMGLASPAAAAGRDINAEWREYREKLSTVQERRRQREAAKAAWEEAVAEARQAKGKAKTEALERADELKQEYLRAQSRQWKAGQEYRQEARDYLEAEEEYKEKTGAYKDPATVARLKAYLEQFNTGQGGGAPPASGAEDGPPKPVLANPTSVPKVGKGGFLDNTLQAKRRKTDKAGGSAAGLPRIDGGTGGGGRAMVRTFRSMPAGEGSSAAGAHSFRPGAAPSFDARTGAESGRASRAARPAPPPGEDARDLPPETRERVSKLLRKAERQLQVGDYMKALLSADRAIALAPLEPRGYLLKTKALTKLRRYEEAEVSARRAVELDPDNPEAHLSLAWVLLHLNRPVEAIVAATRAIKLDPKDAKAYAMRALAYERMGDHEAKLKDLRMAAKLNPKRFAGHLEAALAGKTLFDPEAADSWKLLDSALEPAKRTLSVFSVLGGLAILAALALIGARTYLVKTSPK